MLVDWGIWTEPSRYWKGAETSWFGPSIRAKIVQSLYRGNVFLGISLKLTF